MFNVLFYLYFIIASADWYLVLTDRYKLRIAIKPLALITLIAWFTISGGWQGQTALIGAGLIFSLTGDIFLLKSILLVRPGMFQFGLFSFLAAHILYIFAFNTTFPGVSFKSFGLLCLFGIVAFFCARLILGGLRRKPEGKKQQGPVIFYLVVISLMVISASYLLFRPEWVLLHAALVAAGALLFYLSDLFLAYNAFVKPFNNAGMLIIVNYHLAQAAIVSGMLLHAYS